MFNVFYYYLLPHRFHFNPPKNVKMKALAHTTYDVILEMHPRMKYNSFLYYSTIRKMKEREISSHDLTNNRKMRNKG